MKKGKTMTKEKINAPKIERELISPEELKLLRAKATGYDLLMTAQRINRAIPQNDKEIAQLALRFKEKQATQNKEK